MSDNYSPFDDEDQAKPAAKPAAKSGARAAAAAAAPVAGVQTVTMTVAALIGVVALLLGVIIGIVIPVGVGSSPATTSPSGSVTPDNVSAPQLSPEQMKSGELPAGHPDLSNLQGGGSTGTTETGK